MTNRSGFKMNSVLLQGMCCHFGLPMSASRNLNNSLWDFSIHVSMHIKKWAEMLGIHLWTAKCPRKPSALTPTDQKNTGWVAMGWSQEKHWTQTICTHDMGFLFATSFAELACFPSVVVIAFCNLDLCQCAMLIHKPSHAMLLLLSQVTGFKLDTSTFLKS